MESMLHELYFGNVSPWERKRIYPSEYTEITQQINEIVAHFKMLLSPEDYAKFEEMQNLRVQTDIIDNVDLFKYSFCLGAMMMMDIFGYAEK